MIPLSRQGRRKTPFSYSNFHLCLSFSGNKIIVMFDVTFPSASAGAGQRILLFILKSQIFYSLFPHVSLFKIIGTPYLAGLQFQPVKYEQGFLWWSDVLAKPGLHQNSEKVIEELLSSSNMHRAAQSAEYNPITLDLSSCL